MGGCRCSYRTCSVRSDGKTHMFHFPVYDKVRCHQWIINAKRYEFFNLTVSQVRNRVVCQHHFKEYYFMNYKKEKLTFEAVPTENGPFCSSQKEETTEATEAYSFVLSDIENETCYIDKKANSSIKYADFLSNLDLPVTKSDLEQTSNAFIIPPKVISKQQGVSDLQIKSFQNIVKGGIKTKDSKPHNSTVHSEHYKKSNSVSIQNSVKLNKNNNDYHESNDINHQSYTNLSHVPLAEKVENVNVNLTKQPVSITPCYVDSANMSSINQPLCIPENAIIEESKKDNNIYCNINQPQNTLMLDNKGIRIHSDVKIISEETILPPLPFLRKTEPVPLSLILRLPSGRKERESVKTQDMRELQITNKIQNPCNEILKNDSLEIQVPKSTDVMTSEVLESNNISFEKPKLQIEVDSNNCETNNTPSAKPHHSKILNKSKEQETKISILKHKIAPDRIAAIEKKRIFNKKLRDIVETCLENSDSKIATNNMFNAKDTENIENNVEFYPSKESRLAGAQEYKKMTDLEARIIKMENMLVTKIEQNSERISELKSCLVPHKSIAASTQTTSNEESYKKYLFNELSKFLSASTNSLIYEELFINKYAQKVSECEPKPKRRKRR